MNHDKFQSSQQAFSGGNIPDAAVVGGSVVSFSAGMSSQDREDIYLSNLFAQMATRSAYRDGLVGNWFDYYRNKLRFLGWDSASPVRPVPVTAAFMADNVCQQISHSFGERFSSQPVKPLSPSDATPLRWMVLKGPACHGTVVSFRSFPASKVA